MTIVDLITKHEGVRNFPYTDSVGKLIGVGRNLTDIGLRDGEVMVLLNNDLEAVQAECAAQIPCFNVLDPVRQAVLLDMAFNLGVSGLLEFKNTLTHVAAGEWQDAANGMLASKWASQVGSRAQEDAAMMASGIWPA